MLDFSSKESNIRFRSYIDFRTDFLRETMDWSVDNIFKKIWFADEWNRCAKGGNENERFAKKRDMDYLSHIFSGVSMALKVLDYKYEREPIKKDQVQEEILSIKRAIFCYLFHDYNKITGSDYRMDEKGALFELIEKYLSKVRNELDLSNDQVYQVAFSTESGTTFNILKDNNLRSNLVFESKFSKLADQLSSRFNENVGGDQSSSENSIEWGREPIIPGKHLKKVHFGVTSLYACSDVARKSCKIAIEHLNGGFYLWSTNKAIFYVYSGGNFDVWIELEKTFRNLISEILRPEKLLSFNDRGVINSASGIVEHTQESISRFVKEDEFKKCIWLEDIDIGTHNRTTAENYSDAVRLLTASFSINFRTLKDKPTTSLRDGLQMHEIRDDDVGERLRVFMTRYVQLVTGLTSPNARELRGVLDTVLEKYKNGILNGLIGKISKNSALLIPFAIQDVNVDWDTLLKEILTDLNKGINSIDYSGILSKVVSDRVDLLELPEVPNKFEMSMVNGYPATERATGENLFGINTQTFNNRLPTSGISNGKIDDISKFEFALRRNIAPRTKSGGEGLMFMSFPGAIPFLDMSAYMTSLSYSPNEELGDWNELTLSIDEISTRERKVRLDSAFFYSVARLKSEEDVLRNTYHALNIYRRTKMLVRLSFSNAPFFEDQYEAVRIEVGSSICSAMKWEKIRCNQIEKVKSQISTFNVVVNGSISKIDFAKTAKVIGDYIQQPMSLFYHVHKLVFNEKDQKRTGFGTQFSQKIPSIRELAYESNKDGGRKMKNITELAKSAAKMVRPNWKMSGNDRTWMLRDSLEGIERTKVSVTNGEERDLIEYKVIVEGVLLKTLERDKDKNWMPRDTDIADFADKLIKLLQDDFGSKIPSGSMKSYLINAYEFEYMRGGKGDEM